MQKVVHKAEERGVAEHGWLHSRFSFSFADWYDPTRMGFGALRVINDDVVDPSSGFGMHPHRDMEIVTVVREGAVTHEDSMGNKGVVRAGEVQVMSAGTGVVHSEMNVDPHIPLSLFQIWIYPDRPGHEPRYAQATQADPILNEPQLMVGPWGSDAPLTIHQNARLLRLIADKTCTLSLTPGSGVYALVVTGSVTVLGESLGQRDAVGVWDTDSVVFVPGGVAELLLIEVPLK